MSLRDQFVADLERVFFKEGEHATREEFRISDGRGGFIVTSFLVIWDTDQAKKHPLSTIHGLYVGEVLCYVKQKDLPRRPIAGELIYSPANRPWEVIDCWVEEGAYVLGLNSTRSQPAYYGGN